MAASQVEKLILLLRLSDKIERCAVTSHRCCQGHMTALPVARGIAPQPAVGSVVDCCTQRLESELSLVDHVPWPCVL